MNFKQFYIFRTKNNLFFNHPKKRSFFLYIIIPVFFFACNPVIVPGKSNFITIYEENGNSIGQYPINSKWLGFKKSEYFDLKQLYQFKNLESLELTSPRYNEFRVLEKIKNLKILVLEETSLKYLSDIKNPEIYKLNISNTKITSIKGISFFQKLTDLDISKTQVQDISPLKNLKKLRHLYIQNTNISNIEALSFTKNLYNLYLKNSKVTDLKPIFELEELTFLEITGLSIPKEQVKFLKKKHPYLVIIE